MDAKKTQAEKCSERYFQTDQALSKKVKFPQCINIDICDMCNYDCVFCPRARYIKQGSMMKEELVYRLMEEAYELGAREICFHLNGEPLLNNNLEKYIQFASQKGYKYIFMTTNGYLANIERMQRIIEAGINSIRFSLNSLEDKYKIIHGNGDYTKVLSNINNLIRYKKEKKVDVRIGISIVKTKYTVDDCKKLKKEFEDKVDDITVFEVKGEGGQCPANKELYVNSEDGIKNINKIPCPIVFNACCITTEGYLTLCCGDAGKFMAVADLNNCTLEEAWNCKLATDFREKMINENIENTICYNCIYDKMEEFIPLNPQYSDNYIFDSYDENRLERIEKLKELEKQLKFKGIAID